jgi:hypothetical protein
LPHVVARRRADRALRIYNPLPRNGGVGRESVQCVPHESRLSREPCETSDLPVSSDTPARDPRHNVEDASMQALVGFHGC